MTERTCRKCGYTAHDPDGTCLLPVQTVGIGRSTPTIVGPFVCVICGCTREGLHIHRDDRPEHFCPTVADSEGD